MTATESALSQLSPVGAWLQLGMTSAAHGRQAAQDLEELGYGAVWLNESPWNKESLSHAAVILAATSRLVVATGIAQIWARDPMAMAHGEKTLGEAFPGRFVLGMGVSHAPHVRNRGHDYVQPVARMCAYLDAMDAVEYGAPEVPVAVPRVLGALRPRMLELARDRADGAHPYLVTPRHTADARRILGDGKLLAPMQLVLLEKDPVRARAAVRERFAFYLRARNYANSLLHQGFSEDDLTGGGSDHLVDSLVAWGNVDAVAARIREHHDAGADHVAIQPVSADVGTGMATLAELAPAVSCRVKVTDRCYADRSPSLDVLS